jgi:hypothetical protein
MSYLTESKYELEEVILTGTSACGKAFPAVPFVSSRIRQNAAGEEPGGDHHRELAVFSYDGERTKS